MSIIQEQKNQFFEDGYIVVKNLITQDEVETLRRHYQDIVLGHIPDFPQHHISLREVEGRADYGQASPTSEPEPPIAHGPHHDRRDTQVYPKGEEHYADQRQAPIEDPLDAVRKINVPSRHHPTFDAFARHPKVVDIIADLMGPNIKLYYDQVFAKPPYDRANRFHQDSVFWSFFASNFQITCQLLLDDATVANGCIRFIPGSHHFGLIGWDHLPYTLTEDPARPRSRSPSASRRRHLPSQPNITLQRPQHHFPTPPRLVPALRLGRNALYRHSRTKPASQRLGWPRRPRTNQRLAPNPRPRIPPLRLVHLIQGVSHARRHPAI